MDQFIGFIIFAAIAIGSWVLKAREQRQEAERRKQRAEQADSQEADLPQATRRMLYGDEAVPTARPKGGHDAGETGDEEGWRPAPPPRPQPQPVRREAPQRQPLQPQRPQQTQPAAPRRSLQDLWQEAQRRIEQELQQQQPQAAPPPRPPAIPTRRVQAPESHAQRYTREEEEAIQRRRQEERQRRKRQAAMAAQWEADRAARRKASLLSMLTNLHEVRRGVVMQEVLGPPKALRSE